MPIGEIDVWQGEISDLEVDALIVPANESLFMTGPIARAVKRRAGEEVEREAVAQGPVAPGTVVTTSAGSLAASHVIHAVAVGHELRADAERLRTALDLALATAEDLGLRRVALAPLGVERGVFPPAEVAALTVDVLGHHGDLAVVIATANAGEAGAFRAALDGARAEAR
jgi:O-acetyl-ADP-ribose deacetylase (regulator of RNase III)